MSESSYVKICPECGSTQGRPREKCWLCGMTISPLSSPAVSATPEKQPSQNFSFSLATLMLLMTLASIGLGLTTIYPHLGVLVCVLLVPALVRTSQIVRRRKATGVPVSNAEKTGLFLASFSAATVLLIVIIAVVFIGIWAIFLLVLIANQTNSGRGILSFGQEGFLMMAAIVLAGVISIWIYCRYRRDTNRD